MPPVHCFFSKLTKYLRSISRLNSVACAGIYEFSPISKTVIYTYYVDMIPVMVSDSRTDYNFKRK